jgi:hypothetical protein
MYVISLSNISIKKHSNILGENGAFVTNWKTTFPVYINSNEIADLL